jgi:hypothetical protein
VQHQVLLGQLGAETRAASGSGNQRVTAHEQVLSIVLKQRILGLLEDSLQVIP